MVVTLVVARNRERSPRSGGFSTSETFFGGTNKDEKFFLQQDT